MLVAANQEIDEDLATVVQEAGIEMVKIRSVLTCASRRGVCAKCYGRDLATGRMVEMGLAVGVVAAQSIGEPGTQLTMRTFHIGGTASRISEQSTQESRHAGTVRFENISSVETGVEGGIRDMVVMNRNGSLIVRDAKGRDVEHYQVIYGARLRVTDGQKVEPGQVLLEWDPFTFSILTEEAGTVKFKDIIADVTVHEEVDEVTGMSRRIIIEGIDEKKQPLVEIRNLDGKVLRKYHIPSHAHLMVEDGDAVTPGAVLAKIPRETTKTKDITGGLPRVVELFEARKPREAAAVISEIDGIVKIGGIVKGQRKIMIVPEEEGGEPREYSLPRGVHVNVQDGDRVRAGEQLMDGPSNPHDILAVLGEKELQRYLVNEIQEVYRLQGVNINDKHIETIVRQMMRWVKIEDVGDTEFLIDDVVDRFRFIEENERVVHVRWRAREGPPDAARHHQGVALDRLVHLGGLLPGDHARAHRGVHQRAHRHAARPEGERHDGPAHPGGYGLLRLQQRAHPVGCAAAPAAAVPGGRGPRARPRLPVRRRRSPRSRARRSGRVGGRAGSPSRPSSRVNKGRAPEGTPPFARPRAPFSLSLVALL